MVVTTRQHIPLFSSEHLEALSKVLGDTERGLTGTEIGHILAGMGVSDVDSVNTKWKRLYNALAGFQNEQQVGNHVIVFIVRAMEPAKYTGHLESFHWRRDRLNEVLAFCGYAVGEDGKVRKANQASSLNEALERANRLGGQLRQRGVHADVLRFCNSEILAKNYFHAVFEALKSITAKLRDQAGLTSDGAALVDAAFGFSAGTKPLLAINALDTETLKGEQRGFLSLLKGLYGVIRNPLAHEPKIEWEMTEQDALDILTMLSLVHRKLDKVHRPQ